MEKLNWLDTVNHLKGVGPVTAKNLNQLGVMTIKDLMFHFPFRYEDMSVRDIQSILDGEKVTLKGKLVTPPVVNYYGARKNRLTFRLALDPVNIISVVFFNQAYLAKNIEIGDEFAVYGKWQHDRQSLAGMKIIKQSSFTDGFAPVYSSTKGLKQNQIIKALQSAFELTYDSIEDVIPQSINDKYQLLPLNQALYQMHFPENKEAFHQAERKIIFQEFFLYQWQLQLSLYRTRQSKGIQVHYDNDQLKAYISQLPYELTPAQKKAVNEICYDLLAPYPMRRMLQGDVGSGKTLVAFMAMLAAVTAGYQTLLLVPTELLAKQHVTSFNSIFEKMGLHAELLVSVMDNKEKTSVIEGLASGRIRIVIGTHALIQPNISFKKLGLAIIDEQHRFGVNQRQSLMDKVDSDALLNVLQMTATPIPRSLALTIYGDMAVSTIDQLPKGRIPIKTKLVEEDNIERVYQHIEKELENGRQIYYVLPLINESEALEQIENVIATQERLKERFPHWQIDVLHGQLNKDDQRQVMDDFIQNQSQILVATTMVEVGVDVPNATIMVIQSAERFGLAQLHQLRGRVGRSHLASYCYLIGKPTTEQGKKRLETMERENDGFLISQEDMKIRGMGDVLGHLQSGLPEFHYANLIEDEKIHQFARMEVQQSIREEHKLSEQEIAKIEEWIADQFIFI